MQENLCLGFVNNTGADQPMLLCRLISAFVIRFLKSIISKVATSEISIFLLVSVAKETDLSLPLLEKSMHVNSDLGYQPHRLGCRMHRLLLALYCYHSNKI